MRIEWIVLLGLILTLTLDKDVYCQNSEHKICFDFDSHVLIYQYDSKIAVITSQIESNDYSYIKIFGYSSPVEILPTIWNYQKRGLILCTIKLMRLSK